jgi:hypothetical protein
MAFSKEKTDHEATMVMEEYEMSHSGDCSVSADTMGKSSNDRSRGQDVTLTESGFDLNWRVWMFHTNV